MTTITVEINNRKYEMACEDGQEDHLHSLAAGLDKQVSEMQAQFGQIGDVRLMVMASLMVSDNLEDALKSIASLKDEIEGLKEARNVDAERRSSDDEAVATMLEATAERIEALSARVQA